MSQTLVRLWVRTGGSAGPAAPTQSRKHTRGLLLPRVCSVTANLQLAPKEGILMAFSFRSVTDKCAVAGVKVSAGTEIIITSDC